MFPSISQCKPAVVVRIFSDENNNINKILYEFVEGGTLRWLKNFNRNVTKYIIHWAIGVGAKHRKH